MTIKKCIDEAVKAGEMDAARANAAKEQFDEIELDLRGKLGTSEAEAQAGRRVADQIEFEAARKRVQSLKQVAAQDTIIRGMKADKLAKGRLTTKEPAFAAFDNTGMDSPPYRSAQQNRNVVQGRAHAMISDVLARFRRNLAGNTRDKATLLDVVREAFGDSTGNANAKALAEAWYEASEFLRKNFNEAGGYLPKLERWGMPQMHDAAKIGKSTMEEWREFVKPLLDLEKTIDPRTGRPFSAAELEDVLAEVYETLRTGGMSKLEPSGIPRSRMLGNARADHRFLHFETADKWIKYQDEFGVGDIFSSMMAHIDAMSRDIGLMQTLGPNPLATIRLMQQTMKKEGALAKGVGAAKIKNETDSAAAHLNNLYDQYTGAANAPTNATVARSFGTLRGLLTAAQLTKATLSAISDLAFGRMAARTSGLNQARLLKRHLSLLDPRNFEHQKLAVRLGLVAENWSQVASAQMRYVGEVAGSEVSRRISDAVLRVTGLSPWTQAGKWAFGMEFMGTLADNAARRFDELDPALQATLRNNNIDSAAWDVIRRTDIYEPDMGGFIRPDDIADEELGIRVLAMVQRETDFAVPSTSLRGRAALMGNLRPGNIPGELMRSVTMYKSFSTTMYFTHVRRLANQQGMYNKASYGAHLMISTTLMGALAMQLKNIARGKDPQPMFGEHTIPFWTAAALQGGGFGIFGDYVFSDTNRFGGGIRQTIAGPVVGWGVDTFDLTKGNLQQLINGQKTNFASEVTRYAKKYLPGSSAWFAGPAFERLVFDQIEAAIDPGAQKRWRRQERRLNKEMGNQYFWKRGKLLPGDAPDIGSAFDPLPFE